MKRKNDKETNRKRKKKGKRENTGIRNTESK
jgi:hypothetical protein